MTPSLEEPRRVYERLRKKFGGFPMRSPRDKTHTTDVAFGPGRDPGSLTEAIGALSSQMGWSTDLARAELVAQWPDIVGSDIASHAVPVGSFDGVLEIHCDSSAWATQLRLMRAELLDSLASRFPAAAIIELSIKAPGAPSWKHGRRSVPGRGPRDTYG
jgi:predicted nucleic acid-binding Zn ribbon protein